MKSILHICDYSAPYKGNFVSSLLALEKYLIDESGMQTIYMFPNRCISSGAMLWIDELRQEGRKVFVQTDSFIRNRKMIDEIIEKNKVSIVFRHFNDLRSDIILKTIKVLDVFRFSHCMNQPSSYVKRVLRTLLYKDNIMVGVSEAAFEMNKKIYPKLENILIENAIDFSRLDVVEERFEKNEKPSFLTMGYNVNVKGVDLTLEALNIISKSYEIVLYIAVADNEDSLLECINNRFGQIPKWIKILPPTNNIGTYYRNIDYFLSPSRSEAFCYAVVEAAYCKNTIIASKIPGQGDLDVDNIYWFESENVEDYVRAIKAAIINKKSDDILKDNISIKVYHRYSIDNWTEKVASEINSKHKH